MDEIKLNRKKCKNCGDEFLGKANSQYCKDCKKLRKLIANEERRKRIVCGGIILNKKDGSVAEHKFSRGNKFLGKMWRAIKKYDDSNDIREYIKRCKRTLRNINDNRNRVIKEYIEKQKTGNISKQQMDELTTKFNNDCWQERMNYKTCITMANNWYEYLRIIESREGIYIGNQTFTPNTKLLEVKETNVNQELDDIHDEFYDGPTQYNEEVHTPDNKPLPTDIGTLKKNIELPPNKTSKQIGVDGFRDNYGRIIGYTKNYEDRLLMISVKELKERAIESAFQIRKSRPYLKKLYNNKEFLKKCIYRKDT
jgi:hypothetical protein